ncbi:MAG: DevR family CRISPR-associated autoregulator [Armatimonadetes bacterium]|nr:DevR family CRISPR-associated autoregulator [Armatimonadota bacterium]
MNEKQAVYSLSICGRAILDVHSLNNEGGEGNQIATRMVNVVYRDRTGGDYKLATVNAISGDMLKHIQAEHLYLLAKGRLPLCQGCRRFSASRVLDDRTFMSEVVGKREGKKWKFNDSEVIDRLLATCVLDDIEGILIAPERGRTGTSEEDTGVTEGGEQRRERIPARSVPRKSVAEFGWVVGVPDYTTTDSYFHVRFATERGEQAQEAQQQAIFHRPASSGVYAVVAGFEMARIGFNDISQQYAISDEEREERYLAFLESILYTFLEPNGAMRGTQNPHIVEFSGTVSVTNQVMPAPVLSPLDQDYRRELARVAGALNDLKPGAIDLYNFDSMGQFAEVMRGIIKTTRPYKMDQ